LIGGVGFSSRNQVEAFRRFSAPRFKSHATVGSAPAIVARLITRVSAGGPTTRCRQRPLPCCSTHGVPPAADGPAAGGPAAGPQALLVRGSAYRLRQHRRFCESTLSAPPALALACYFRISRPSAKSQQADNNHEKKQELKKQMIEKMHGKAECGRICQSDSELVDHDNCVRGAVTVRSAEMWQHVKTSHRIVMQVQN
jgi:hypothetical protein